MQGIYLKSNGFKIRLVFILRTNMSLLKNLFIKSDENELTGIPSGKSDIIREHSESLFEKSSQYFPGGVNSPVRAFRAVGGTPIFMNKGEGCHIYDVDGNKFIDFCGSWGPLILGHNNVNVREKVTQALQNGTSFGTPTPLENELAELILKNHRFLDKIRFVSSGTEAVMSAIRLARGFTGRDKIIKFEGCYHGAVDSLLVKAGSGLVTSGMSSSAGVPESFSKETIVLPLSDLNLVQKAFQNYKDQIAAIIIEPIPANNGLILLDKDYLEGLRSLCTEYGALLIFDEVISGFRIGFEGAAGYYQIAPDLITYGKIIGGGLPVGCYGGRENIMDHVAPLGDVYQAGTLSGNPIAMAAGYAQLNELLKIRFYKQLNDKAEEFSASIQRYATAKNYAFRVFYIGSIFWFAFTDKATIKNASEIDPDSMEYFKVLHKELLNRGIYFGPSGYEVGFISMAHTKIDLEIAKRAIFETLDIIFTKVY